jgi:hypothetical protein
MLDRFYRVVAWHRVDQIRYSMFQMYISDYKGFGIPFWVHAPVTLLLLYRQYAIKPLKLPFLFIRMKLFYKVLLNTGFFILNYVYHITLSYTLSLFIGCACVNGIVVFST